MQREGISPAGREDPASKTGKGRAAAARRLEEAHKLLDEIEYMLADMRRTLLGGGRQR